MPDPVAPVAQVVEKTRRQAQRGWGPPNLFVSVEDQCFAALVSQKAAYITALTYIADEAGPDDLDTIKQLAHIALGREHN